jgi:hypothetical protein
MIDERPLGIIVAMVGALGTAVAALADPLGIGEGNVFGWLQLTGVIVGGVVTLLGLGLAMEWVPYPGRSAQAGGAAAGSAPQTTVITDSKTSDPARR